jgi:uncharacterized protein YkwD
LLAIAIGVGAAVALPAHDVGARAVAGSGPIVAVVPYGSPDFVGARPHPKIPRPTLAPNRTLTSTSAHAAPTHAAPPPRPAPPSIVIGSTQQMLINADRARAGLRALSWSSCLYSVALSNARRMAAQGFISHTNGPSADLGCHLGSYAGENVGYWTGGANDAQLNAMFMNSPDHRANIMGPYRYVATAWVTASNGVAYIAVEFS